MLGWKKKRHTSAPAAANDAEETFEALIEENLDGLYHLALRYTRDPSKAEDLVHDTVVRALRFRQTFEPGTHFRAWIFRILTNTFMHRYRRSRLEHEALLGSHRMDVQERFEDPQRRRNADAPEASFFSGLMGDEVSQALDKLPEDFRTAVTLCDLEGLSYKEIAEVMGTAVGTVMSRLHRGRRLLRAQLTEYAQSQGIGRQKDIDRPKSKDTETDAAQVTELEAFRKRVGGGAGQ